MLFWLEICQGKGFTEGPLVEEQDHSSRQRSRHRVHEDVGDGVDDGDDHLDVDGSPAQEGEAGEGRGGGGEGGGGVEQDHPGPH